VLLQQDDSHIHFLHRIDLSLVTPGCF